MSYREQRNIADLLRRMGYPRLISQTSFRSPNFLLVADILKWFLRRFDSSVDMLSDLSTETQRVNFIRSFVHHMLKKTGLKLNPKRLYQSDGYAVKEIIKVIQFFSNATKEASEAKRLSNPGQKDALTQFYELQPTLHKVRGTRDLSTFLTEKGVAFFDLITKEITNRPTREAVLSKPFDLKDYEHVIRKAITATKTEELKLQANIEAAESTLNSLNTKIDKKGQELERSEQRLETMTKVRPAYMDEFEKIQRELEVLYYDYVSRFRILCHLQHQMEDMGKMDESRRNEAKLLQAGSREEGLGHGGMRMGVGDELSGSENEDDDESLLDDSLQQNAREVLSRGGKQQQWSQGAAKNGVKGKDELIMPSRMRSGRNGVMAPGVNMYGGLDDDEEESESDMLLLEGDNSDLGSEIDDEADLALSMRRGGSYTKPEHNPRQAINGLNGNGLTDPLKPQRSTSFGSTGSQNALDETVDLESFVPNGTIKSSDRDSRRETESYGGGDSLTKPLRPEPRYNSGPLSQPQISSKPSGRPSTKHRMKRSGSGAPVGGERPPTRPASRVTKLLDDLNDDDF